MSTTTNPTETLTDTVRNAIHRSITHDEIAHVEARTVPEYRELCEILAVECDDNVEARTGSLSEYWGTDEDGDDWRVHVSLRGVE